MNADIQPNLVSSFEYNGHVVVEWYDIISKEDLPELPWGQVYAVGNLEGLVPVVLYGDTVRPNLPGGKPEQGETVEQTLKREIQEELNCEVTDWQPIGYQKLTREGDIASVYQLRVYAGLQKIGEFENDPAGTVIGYKTVPLASLNEVIEYGIVGERLVSLSSGYFT